jgi:hypothetical protein
MSNKSQDHVHRLIRAMSSQEKRYFKLFIGRTANQGHNNHQVLFDAILEQEVYDEAHLLLRFKEEAFTHRFAITKRRLYEAILRSLDAFHAERSVDARIGRSLHQVQILYDKALYDDAARMLHSATRMARQHDRHHAQLAALEWEQRLAEQDNYGQVDLAEVERIGRTGAAVREDMAEVDGLWEIKSRLFLTLYRKGQVRNERMRRSVEKVLEDPLLQDPELSRTARARYLHHHVRGAAAFAMGDMEECRKHLMLNLGLLVQERDRFLNEPNLVLSVLGNLAYVCAALGRFSEALDRLKEFRQAPVLWEMAENEDLDLKLFATSMSLELGIQLRMGRPDLAIALVPSIERGLSRYGDRLGELRRASFQYHLAYTHFLMGRHDHALRWNNALLDGIVSDEGSDLAVAGRCLYLVLLFETGKHDLIPYALRNMERYLHSRDRVHRFEPMLMNLVKTLCRSSQEEGRRPEEQFREALMPLLDDPFERAALEQFDALSWAQARLQGRPLHVVVQERAEQGARAA